MSETNRFRWSCTNCGAAGEIRAVDDADALRWARTHSGRANCRDSVEATWVGKIPAAPEHDPVSRPIHYHAHPSGIEPIALCEHEDFLTGNALKYILRHRYKGKPIEDLEKARYYIDRRIAQLEKERDAS